MVIKRNGHCYCVHNYYEQPYFTSIPNQEPFYGEMVKPKLAEGVSFDTERVVKMDDHWAVYVRSLYPFEGEDEGKTDEKSLNLYLT